MRTLAADIAAATPAKTRINPVAMELGLQDGTMGPAAVVGAAAASSALANGTANGASGDENSGLRLPPTRYYDTLLDLTEKLFDQEVDQATYEESVRFMFGINAYTMFTIDKLIMALIKTAQTITTDSKSQRLLEIVLRDRARSTSGRPTSSTGYVASYKQQIATRMVAEAIVGKDENMFRIEWVPNGCTLLLQMLSRDDLTLDEAQTMEEKWLYYISSYCLWVPTEGLPNLAHAPFLKRNMPKTEEISDPVGTTYSTRSGLEIKVSVWLGCFFVDLSVSLTSETTFLSLSQVCIRTYKLFFVAETEDLFSRHRPTPTPEASKRASAQLVQGRKRRSSKFDSWIEQKSKDQEMRELEEQRLANQASEDVATGDKSAAEKTVRATENGIQEEGEKEANGEGNQNGATEEKKMEDVSMEAA